MARRHDPVEEDIAKRLARIAGHASSLKKFWEDDRECDEILTQVSAVRAALDQVAKLILLNQFEKLMDDAIDDGKSGPALKKLKKALDRVV